MIEQLKQWEGNFGEEYTKRNIYTSEEVNDLYLLRYGVSRTSMNKDFIGSFNKDIIILEIGTNIGIQLNLLFKMGFKNLYGIEINPYAIKMFHEINKGLPIYVIRASAFDIPFKNNYFDLVFTSGFLIHISPRDINRIMNEIYRCTKNYIWCFEYFEGTGYKEVPYRGKSNLLWKTNFNKLFLNNYSDLKLIKECFYPNTENLNLIDHMFLLEKI